MTAASLFSLASAIAARNASRRDGARNAALQHVSERLFVLIHSVRQEEVSHA